jgi:nucleoside-diphosphate-sugar epimerase
MKRLLVTGAGGLFGRALVQHLSESDFDVTAVYREERDDAFSTANAVAFDLAAPDARTQLSELEFDIVIHAAARISSNSYKDFQRDNIESTLNLLAVASKKRCEAFIYTSTISVYDGDGPFTEDSATQAITPYAKTKLIAEQSIRDACRGSSMRGATLRFAGLHGKNRNSGVVHNFLQRAKIGACLEVVEPNSELRLLFIGDALRAMDAVLATTNLPSYSCFNIASADKFTTLALAKTVVTISGTGANIKQRASEVKRNKVMCIRHAKNRLGFYPQGLQENLRDMSEDQLN